MTEIATPTEPNILRAVALMRQGRPVAFPTETVYGLGAPAEAQHTVDRVFELKGRPRDKPLIVHVNDADQARRLVDPWTEGAEILAQAFWPGPLTLILPSNGRVAPAVTAGGSTLAVRAPSHSVARALIASLGEGIAAPSANLSGEPPPTTAPEVAKQLGEQLAMVLDGGATTVAVPSTIVDLTDEAGARILRLGAVTRAQLSTHIRLID
ncbi:MAG: L-threonylcarbamoyladenylate synthase [Polyangiaceae bacterium]